MPNIFKLEKLAQLQLPLSLNGILELQKMVQGQDRIPAGQKLLFRNRETLQLQTLSSLTNNDVVILRNMFLGLIQKAGEEIQNYDVSTDQETDSSYYDEWIEDMIPTEKAIEEYIDDQVESENRHFDESIQEYFIERWVKDFTENEAEKFDEQNQVKAVELAKRSKKYIPNPANEQDMDKNAHLVQHVLAKMFVIHWYNAVKKLFWGMSAFKTFSSAAPQVGQKVTNRIYPNGHTITQEDINNVQLPPDVVSQLHSIFGRMMSSVKQGDSEIQDVDWTDWHFNMEKDMGELYSSTLWPILRNHSLDRIKNLDKQLYNHIIFNVDESLAIDAYKEAHERSLRESFDESQYETNVERMKDVDHELSGQVNVTLPKSPNSIRSEYAGPLERWAYLAKPVYESTTEGRVRIDNPILMSDPQKQDDYEELSDFANTTLEDFKTMADALRADLSYVMDGAAGAYTAIVGHIAIINNYLASKPVLKKVFGRDTTSIPMDENDVKVGQDYAIRNTIDIEEYMDGEKMVEVMEQKKAEREEQARIEQEEIQRQWREQRERKEREEKERKANEKKRLEEKNKLVQDMGQSVRMTPEELQKTKEYGISKKPFGFEYQSQFSDYPGSFTWRSFQQGQDNNLDSFRIAIYPEAHPRIPADVLQRTQLHKLPESPSPETHSPAIGWIGGYFDLINKIMYITEVQSDVMQRLVNLKDPQESIKTKTQELQRLQNEIQRLSTQQGPTLEMKIQGLQDKINRTDPNAPNYAALVQALEKMKAQPQRPQQQNPQVLAKIETYKKEIRRLEQEIEADKRFKPDQQFQKSDLHEYRSILDNQFKDWIGLFFNTAMRVAKRSNLKFVYITTPEELLERWKKYAGEQTHDLLERIYDRWANFYGAKKQDKWYVIDMSNPNLKIAKTTKVTKMSNSGNWYKKVKLASFQRQFWTNHFDTFMKVFLEKTTTPKEPWQESVETPEDREHSLREAFSFWLDQVPSNLKDPEGNLLPDFAQEVKQYAVQNYGFDPFIDPLETTETQSPTPTAEELEEQFSSPAYTPKVQAPSAEELENWWKLT